MARKKEISPTSTGKVVGYVRDNARCSKASQLAEMHKHGIIDDKRYQGLLKRPLKLNFTRQAERSNDTHFTAHVRKWLIQWADENDYNLQLDGLVVHTTLDYELQSAALRAVERQATALQMVADVEWSQAGAGSGSSASSPFSVTARATKAQPENPIRRRSTTARDLESSRMLPSL